MAQSKKLKFIQITVIPVFETPKFIDGPQVIGLTDKGQVFKFSDENKKWEPIES